jgi:hypothetical protein
MKEAKAHYLPLLDLVDIEEVSSLLDEWVIDLQHVDCVNWQNEYPYYPGVFFKIARSESAFFIKFVVKENNVKAIYGKDQDPVYEDSCVEFFYKKTDSDTYINFEFNCIGTCIATERKSREEIINVFPDNVMKKIKRFSSLGNKTFEEKTGHFKWHLTVKIPLEILGIDIKAIPTVFMANVYKCGDKTSTPHFVSWNPIVTTTPDFHCPQFFGKIFL